MNRYYAIQQAGREADIYIFGDITSWPWMESDVSAYNIVKEIKDLDVDVIHVYINSYGGEVAEGWAIYNALKNHKARIVTHGAGFVASAALYPFMAGDERVASTTSAYYFHHIITSAYGYATDLHKAAEEAEKLNEIGRQAFTQNTDMTDEDVKALEDEETWLSAQEVFEKGIATSIINEKQISAATQSVRRQVMQKVMQPKTKPNEKPKKETAPRRLMETIFGVFSEGGKE